MSWQNAIERTVTGLGYDLVEVERANRGLLRVTIDRLPGDPGGEFVTVDDCEKVTRQLQHVLEVEGFAYERLEVSSPGLDRPLRTAADYARFAGQAVEISLKLPFQGRRKYRGVLGRPEDGAGWRLVLDDAAGEPKRPRKPRVPKDVQDERPRQALDFTLEEVREARLVPVVDFKGRRSEPTPQGPEDAAPAADDVGGREE